MTKTTDFSVGTSVQIEDENENFVRGTITIEKPDSVFLRCFRRPDLSTWYDKTELDSDF